MLLLLFNPKVTSDSFVTPWTITCQAPLVHEISQARILEWIAIFFSRGSSQPTDGICISRIAGRLFTTEPPGKPRPYIKCKINKDEHVISWTLREPTASWLRGRGDIKQAILLQTLYHILPNLQSLCSFSWYSLSSFLFQKLQLSRLEVKILLAILLSRRKTCAQFSFPYNQPFCITLFTEWEKSDFFTGLLILCIWTLWPGSQVWHLIWIIQYSLALKYIILCVSYLEWISSGSIPPDVLVVCIY